MRLVKTLPSQFAESFDRGTVRIGSLRYYAKTEDVVRRDVREGQRPIIVANDSHEDLVIDAASANAFANAAGAPYQFTNAAISLKLKPGTSLSFESDANVFVFCASVEDHSDRHHLKFGDARRYMSDVFAFARVVGSALNGAISEPSCSFRPSTPWACLDYKFAQVVYGEKAPIAHTSPQASPQVLCFSLQDAFVKPELFKPEREFRFVWYFANDNGIQMCPLPRDFCYVDLDVPEMPSLWCQ